MQKLPDNQGKRPELNQMFSDSIPKTKNTQNKERARSFYMKENRWPKRFQDIPGERLIAIVELLV